MVKRKVTWSPEAKIEFVEILNSYYQRNGNANYSRKLNDKIKQATSRLGNAPYLGKKTNNQKIRVIIEGHFLVFYSLSEKQIRILSIVDSRQNPDVLRYKK